MGDLDDAIREHLELKRKHGATEEEMATKEREAERQGALPAEPVAGVADQPAESPMEQSPAVIDDLEPDEVLPEEALELEITRTDLPDDPEDAGEDVLEETPEFLEDMPEQDRLWFEQRPPKDFDFGD